LQILFKTPHFPPHSPLGSAEAATSQRENKRKERRISSRETFFKGRRSVSSSMLPQSLEGKKRSPHISPGKKMRAPIGSLNVCKLLLSALIELSHPLEMRERDASKKKISNTKWRLRPNLTTIMNYSKDLLSCSVPRNSEKC